MALIIKTHITDEVLVLADVAGLETNAEEVVPPVTLVTLNPVYLLHQAIIRNT